MHRNTIRAFIALAALAVAPPLADAGEFLTCSNGKKKVLPAKWLWPDGIYHPLYLSVHSSFSPGNAYRTALEEVFQRWNQAASPVSYIATWGDPSTQLHNGQSEVWWSTGFGAPAAAWVWSHCDTGQIYEVDVLFDSSVNYSTTSWAYQLLPYGGSYRPFQTTAMHEFGHAQGLGHTADQYSVMGQDWTHIHCNGAFAASYPGEDAVATSQSVYGRSGKEDVGIAHWRRTGSSGAYSTHSRTRVFGKWQWGTWWWYYELPFTIVNGEPVYEVTKSTVVAPEFALESMGYSNPVVVDVGYYLSTNSYISTYDTLLAVSTYGDNVGSVYTHSRDVLLPSTLQSGQTYWLGAIADPFNKLDESDEANNAAYIAIKVK